MQNAHPVFDVAKRNLLGDLHSLANQRATTTIREGDITISVSFFSFFEIGKTAKRTNMRALLVSQLALQAVQIQDSGNRSGMHNEFLGESCVCVNVH